MAPFDEITDTAISTLVTRFYGKARQDPTIGPLFNAVVSDWDEHFVKLTDFWSSVMLTTGRYHGNPMAAHLKHPIKPEFFARWLALWHETAAEMFAPEEALQFGAKAERIAESLKLALFYRPGTIPVRPPR
jgi:hemoglobin